MKLTGKTILLGVCGGIAAYKAAALCSKLVQAGAKVHVIMTKSAAQFIAPLTFQTLSRNHVVTDTFEELNPSVVTHIDLADHADLIVIAPGTANMLAKMAYGLGDDMLSTTLLAATAPIVFAPAMNVHMYAHPAVEQNMAILRARGVRFIEPGEGQLACGYVGKGRLAEPEEITAVVEGMLAVKKTLLGRKVLITAGGTKERLDPVRFLSNDSSGKMGFAIAEAAKEMGAEVTLVYGTTTVKPPLGMELIPIESANDMLNAVMNRLSQMDIIIKAAAVADYRAEKISPQKIKKTDERLTLTFVKNIDILQTIGAHKTHQFVVGFAAETENLASQAMSKLQRKNCDLIVANDVTKAGAGFGSDTNIIQIYDRDGLVVSLPIMDKKAAAKELLNLIAERTTAPRSDV
ncbi:MAG: bifunctional phosphopantothenoylcysteine decarboxylase/phosphopantothenate--cysteine ligase CoaBC [Paenibacillaceae bacterium]